MKKSEEFWVNPRGPIDRMVIGLIEPQENFKTAFVNLFPFAIVVSHFESYLCSNTKAQI